MYMRFKLNFFLLVCSLLFALPGYSAKVTVMIETENSKQNYLFVIREADPISRKREILVNHYLNNDSIASVTFDLDETSLVFIRLGWVEYPFYAEPGATYDLLLPEPGNETPRSFSKLAKLSPLFKTIRSDELNYLIAAVNRRYDAFFEEHYMDFAFESLRGNDAWKRNEGERLKKLNWVTENPEIKPVATIRTDSLLVNFSLALLKEFGGNEKSPFFETYLDFTLADLDRMRKMSNEFIYHKYFKGRPVALRNPAYFHMFEWFNSEFVFRWCERAMAEPYVKAFDSGVFGELDVLFAETGWYSDESFRHASLLLAFERDLLIKDAQRMAFVLGAETACKSPFGKVAGRIKELLLRGKKGEKAPGFTLVNAQGEVKELSDFAGKHVYINFYASWCTSCMADMIQIAYLRKTYGKHIEFLSISMDENFEDFKMFVQKKRDFSNPFLFGSHSPVFIDNWGLYALPRYVLLDREGNIVRYEAQSPSGGIERELEKIKTEAEKKPKNGSWN